MQRCRINILLSNQEAVAARSVSASSYMNVTAYQTRFELYGKVGERETLRLHFIFTSAGIDIKPIYV